MFIVVVLILQASIHWAVHLAIVLHRPTQIVVDVEVTSQTPTEITRMLVVIMQGTYNLESFICIWVLFSEPVFVFWVLMVMYMHLAIQTPAEDIVWPPQKNLSRRPSQEAFGCLGFTLNL